MGRHKMELTPQEQQDRKQRWWGEKRNAKRREQYHSDPDYRAKEKERVRRYNGERQMTDLSSKLVGLENKGQHRTVFLPDGSTGTVRCFNTQELGDVLERKPQALMRWRSASKLPPPTMFYKHHNGVREGMYSVAQVRAIVEVLAEHFKDTPYYHESHTETCERLWAAFRAAE